MTSLGSLVDKMENKVNAKFADYYAKNVSKVNVKVSGQKNVVNFYVLPYNEIVKKNSGKIIGKKLEEDRFRFLRKDLLPKIKKLFRIRYNLKQDDILRILEKRYRGIVLRAYYIVDLENRGKNEQASKDLSKFIKCYKETGKRIYNMIRSGVFEPFLTDFLSDLQKDPLVDRSNINHFLSKCLDKIIKYNPICIYVNDGTKETKILGEIKRRLGQRGVNMIGIWGRKEKNILKITSAISDYINSNPAYTYTQRIYKIRKMMAAEFIVRLRNN